MTRVSHTPGPWRAFPTIDERPEVSAFVMAPSGPIAKNLPPADARLIAAAPEMLSLLRWLAAQMLGTAWGSGIEYEGQVTPYDRVSALIAKALGVP